MNVKVGEELQAILAMAVHSNVPVMLRGPHAIGKTDSVNACGASLGIQVVTLNLSALEPTDLTGYPKQVDGRTEFCPPAFLPREGRGILFFDELNRADRSTLSPVYQIIVGRCIHSSGYVLPKGFVPVAAINPASDYDVADLDMAMMSRFMVLDVVANIAGWIKHTRSSGHPAVIRYVESTPEAFTSEAPPRSYTYASSVLRTYEQEGCDNIDRLTIALCGLLGESHGVALTQSFLNNTEDPLSSEIILSGDYEKHRTTMKRWLKEKRVDLINASVHHVLVQLQSPDVVARCKTVDSIRQSLEQLIADVPSDLGKKLKKALK